MSFRVGRRNYVAMHEAMMHGMVHVAVVHVALHEAEQGGRKCEALSGQCSRILRQGV